MNKPGMFKYESCSVKAKEISSQRKPGNLMYTYLN